MTNYLDRWIRIVSPLRNDAHLGERTVLDMRSEAEAEAEAEEALEGGL